MKIPKKTKQNEVNSKTVEQKKAELQAEIEAKNKQDEVDCNKVVEGALKQFNCSLVGSLHFVEGQQNPIFQKRIIKNK
jgi:translation elongation factor EF-Ts